LTPFHQSANEEQDMELKCVVAIVRPDVLGPLEKRLGAIDIHGITVTKVKGFGAHPNLFADDWTTEHIKIEIFAQASDVDTLVRAIMDIAQVGATGDGVVAIFPVERFFRVRTASEALP
jgi:nitrogen regulatory protein P-II 1